jgi:hypothetical protein
MPTTIAPRSRLLRLLTTIPAIAAVAASLTIGDTGAGPVHAASFKVYFANDESQSAADLEQYGAIDAATNKGSGTSAATTLADDTSGPDGSTLGNFEYWDVPALSPGGTFGPDTASLSVPSSVAAGTTALMYIDYGTGKQRVAVIIG